MKLLNLTSIIALALSASMPLQAGVYSYTGGAYDIRDGNLAGMSSQISVTSVHNSLSDLTVSLNVSGGYNGDLYAYLSHNGVLVPLLNRVGTAGLSSEPQYYFGFSTSGFNLKLDDWAVDNIHDVPSPTSGSSYVPDSGSASLANFNTYNPNGTWTLFFADLSGGGGTSRMEGWSLSMTELTVVPEPVNVALGLFAGAFGIVIVTRSRPVWSRVQRCRLAFVQWIDAV